MWALLFVGAVIVIIILYFTGNLPNTAPWVKKQIDVDSLSLDDLSSSCPRMERIREKFDKLSFSQQRLFSETEGRKMEAVYRACQDVKNIESVVDNLSLDDLDSSCPKMEKITEKLGEPSKYMQLFSESERLKLESIHRACQDVKKSP